MKNFETAVQLEFCTLCGIFFCYSYSIKLCLPRTGPCFKPPGAAYSIQPPYPRITPRLHLLPSRCVCRRIRRRKKRKRNEGSENLKFLSTHHYDDQVFSLAKPSSYVLVFSCHFWFLHVNTGF